MRLIIKKDMRRYKIIHLDDHKIITDCTRDLILSDIANCDFLSFNDSYDAFNYIARSINIGEVTDIFITDFNHSGMNGYMFSKSVRELEKKKKCQPMQILLLTMLFRSHPKIRLGLNEKIFDRYFPIFKTENRIVDFIKSNFTSR